ncbi:ABC transporter permease [Mesobacillus foraminis]|uniref:Putative aldouronate transport system permease protein n=1 Tax=Mesobacillus foraminis TaxID=279826 RepID=A0A4R2BNP4_9BACI|nr:sugar ABC transporter permease [Mesobacillus foraminis]TCN27789.1 putative aldouronate transport system permease protein [Mesobacillus foraminis]
MKTVTRMSGQSGLEGELSDSLAVEPKRKKAGFWKVFKQQKYLYMMSIPFVLLVIIFNYLPLWGWSMAFQSYKPGIPFWEQEWVGFQHFIQLFSDERFYLVLRNTLAMSLMSLAIGFVFPILFAVLLNEVRLSIFKRTVQTITYLPHFVSWVVVAGIVTKMLSIDGGIINELLIGLGIVDKPVQFMAKGEYFWSIVVVSDLWKEMGWNAIIFLAAIAGIDPQLYEAAKVDGAGRWRRIWHVTLPGIRPTILVLLILSIGHLTSIGFEKQFLLGNSLVVDYSEVLDLYALNYGIGLGRFSYGTAIGIFNSVVSIILLFLANGIFKRFGNQSVM